MSRIKQEELEKQYGKLVCNQVIRIQDTKFFGDSNARTVEFEMYDGFAYCPDFDGEELFLTYPRLDFVKSCDTMANSIRNFMGLNPNDEITIADIVHSYCEVGKI